MDCGIGEFWDFRFPILDFGFLNGEFGMQSAESIGQRLRAEDGWRRAEGGRQRAIWDGGLRIVQLNIS